VNAGCTEIAQEKPIPTQEQKTAPAAILLTPTELAAKLNVPVSWIREKTRERARIRDKDPLPVVRLGKYVRFSWSAVEAWLKRQELTGQQ
jgi:excisionase family DNA binding protein